MRTFLFSILTTVFLSATAQTSVYFPFPDSDAVWNVSRTGGLINCGGMFVNEQYSYTISGDTSISSVAYHKLFVPHVQFQDTCTSLHKKAGYAGCIRQDTAIRKVFFIAPADTVEYILYDFTLSVGDSLHVPPSVACGASGSTITGIDSIFIVSNYRKRWTVSAPISPYYMIEGIGYTTGLLEPCATFPDAPTWTLTCFQQNGLTLYPQLGNSCDLILSSGNIQGAAVSVSIAPNPFHTSTTLVIDAKELKDENLFIKIYDMTGQLLRQQPISNGTAILNRTLLSEGMYFYCVSGAEGDIARGKFVID